MDKDAIWETIRTERLSLADLLEPLSEEQWNTPSLCEGWRVRDVAAHITLATRARPLAAAAGLIRARGNFDRYTTNDAQARGARPTALLVQDLRDVAGNRYHPPITTDVDPLIDVIVHGQDIAIPLGFDRPMPTAACVTGAQRAWSFPIPFRAKKRCKGVRLQATDADWAEGEGAVAEGPIASILLVLTGRKPGLDGLSGPGVERLAATF